MQMMRTSISSWRRPHGEHRILKSGAALLRSACLTFAPDIILRIFKHGDGRFGVEIGGHFLAARQVDSVLGLAGYRFFYFHFFPLEGARSLGPRHRRS